MKKFKILVLLLPFFVFETNSQELDKEFLESLPDDIKLDILDRADAQDDSSRANYRSSEYSTRLELNDDVIKLKERIERDLLRLDKRLSSSEPITNSNKIFGSDFFDTFQTSFMPTNEPNPDASYRLDVGDVLKIQLIGQRDLINSFVVGGNGSINIPDIGEVVIAGLTLGEASSLIKNNVEKFFLGTRAYINLQKIRDVNILVTGNASNPGVYTLTGNSNILHALTMAGGVGEFGSYREINLLRNNQVVETLDVYDLLINGNYSINKRLRSGDVVFVQARKNLVKIDGAVKRPATYEINEDQFLDSVIGYSLGLTREADKQNIYLERILDGTLKSIPVVNTSQFDSIKPLDGDMIYVREYPFRTATVEGAVIKPGTYTMAPGETFSDLIDKAGGYTSNAYPFGAVYQNDDALTVNKKAKDILYFEFLDSIISMSQQSLGTSIDLAPLLALTEELKSAAVNGRIVVNINEDFNGDRIRVKDGDSVIIPEKTNNVYVYGEVSVEGAVLYESNSNINYFVNKSGGFKNMADFESIYILHPNGETQRYSETRNIFERQPTDNIKIYPGSIIFVPRKLDSAATRRIAAQAYVSILGNIGIALASLSSLNKNN